MFLRLFYSFLALLFGTFIFVSVPQATLADSHEDKAMEKPAGEEQMAGEEDSKVEEDKKMDDTKEGKMEEKESDSSEY